MVRTRVIVRGRVQGVFFRDSCRQEAQQAGVAGWVRNTDDDALEAVFEGEQDAVARLVDWARHGPPQAEVTDLSSYDEEPEGLDGFEVR